MAKSNVFVSPNGGNGWNVKFKGSNLGNYSTQKDAAKVARDYAKIYQTDRVIQGKNGRIRQKDSYGPDPRNILG